MEGDLGAAGGQWYRFYRASWKTKTPTYVQAQKKISKGPKVQNIFFRYFFAWCFTLVTRRTVSGLSQIRLVFTLATRRELRVSAVSLPWSPASLDAGHSFTLLTRHERLQSLASVNL